ncbi:sigma-70 family RNA polymerase sigma factor [Paenibacillus eucommiae]|uniref:RNA polymerase sigma factor n=1 Tax=Paenibacillus eucommiae TaxID=1355755 RepID=A0ABS4J4V3_9BACL|nr:sigma-70 family RNA polymerase sigma factor [Paenibacillus eucommiae]MBP1994862.1 RNA polymerase sigma-70 factor (ECF subfamily) [Paenibacillus eucommiae]
MPFDEQEIVLSASRGDVDAFRRLISKYANAVYAVALNRLGQGSDAEDVAQEVFIKAWYNLIRLEQPGKFGSWLMAIARNTAEDWWRKHGRQREEQLEEELFLAKQSTEEEVLQREHVRAVRMALKQLDEKYRIVAIMYFISGFTVREIAEFLQVTVSATESRLRRAKDKLKKELFELAEQTMSKQKLGETFEDHVVKRIVGISCINFPVKNVDVSAWWYVQHLGCKLVREPIRFKEGANAIIQLGENGPNVFLLEETERTPLHFTRNGVPASLFELKTNDIESFYAQLKEEGVQVGERYDNVPCSKYFDVIDPDGNTITIAEWY